MRDDLHEKSVALGLVRSGVYFRRSAKDEKQIHLDRADEHAEIKTYVRARMSKWDGRMRPSLRDRGSR